MASGATSAYAPMQFYKKAEQYAVDEQFALIRDESIEDKLLLGVIRRVTKREPIVSDRVRTPFIDRPEILDPSLLMPYTSAVVRLYGEVNVAKGQVEEVVHVATPGSRVFIIKDGSFLNNVVKVPLKISVGAHKYSGWELPLDASYVPYHIGVFGATGVGKSRLVRGLVEELVKAGYRAIVFDHSGADYAPHIKASTIGSKSITINPPTIASVLAAKARLTWQTYGEYLEVAVLTYMHNEQGVGVQGKRGVKWSKREFVKHLSSSMSRVGARDSTIAKATLFIDHFIPDEFFDELNKRTIEPSDIVREAYEEGLVVVDLSQDTDLVVKQAIVADTIEAAWSMVKSGEVKVPANMVFVIDEAQNYVPEDEWTICKDAIETTAREGRKWGLSLILASQRMVRDIASNVRANLGTVFFGRLQTQGDLRELSTYLDLSDVSDSVVANLDRREFFVAGLMNPLKRPILIKVREVR